MKWTNNDGTTHTVTADDGSFDSGPIGPNGTLRDTAVYSITADEWPTVKAHLSWQLEKPRSP